MDGFAVLPSGRGSRGRFSQANQAAAFEDVPLQAKLAHFAPQPGQLVALGRGQARGSLLSAALLPVGQGNPRATQARIECDVGSNPRARSSGDRPARTR
jgi:hypothetical protein